SPSNVKGALQLTGVLLAGFAATEVAGWWNHKITPPIKPLAFLKAAIDIPEHVRGIRRFAATAADVMRPNYCLRAKNIYFLENLLTEQKWKLHPFPRQLEDHIKQYHSTSAENEETAQKRREGWLGFEYGISHRECLSEKGLFSDPHTGRCDARTYDRTHTHSDDIGIDRTDRWSAGCFLIDDAVARVICKAEKTPKTALVSFAFKGYKRIVSNSGIHYVYADELRLQSNEPDQAPKTLFGTPLRNVYFIWGNNHELDGLFGRRPGKLEPSEKTYKEEGVSEVKHYFQQRTEIDAPIKLRFYRVDTDSVRLCERDVTGTERATVIPFNQLREETLDLWQKCREEGMRER
ncbi:MAG TPA: hypothetical protein VJJ82_01940, partial [Candidatus Nanoarchaeia archaeon]|nr:hypothetical protein [Candidatus Nanoarchaeia archaeon]